MKEFTRFGLRDVDVESLVRKQSIIYEHAATCWQDGHILGNGDIGAVAYAPQWLEWTVNKIDVFDGRCATRPNRTYREAIREYLKRGSKNTHFLNDLEPIDPTWRGPLNPLLKSCGQVKIRTMANEFSWGGSAPYAIRQTLSLWDATDTLHMRHPGGGHPPNTPASTPTVASLVCKDENLLVISMKNAAGPMWGKRIELCRPLDADFSPPVFGKDPGGDCVWFSQEMPDGSRYAMALRAVSTGGKFRYFDPSDGKYHVDPSGLVGIEEDRFSIWIKAKGDIELFVSAASSRECADPVAEAKRLVDHGAATGFGKLQAEHTAWWSDFWKKSFVRHEDRLIEQMWYFGLYQLASNLKRAPVPGLNGLWYGFTDRAVQNIFWAVYTLDMNVQWNTLPVFAANHPELALPFMDTFLNALPAMTERTGKLYELPGACFPLELGFCGDPTPVSPSYRLNLVGGPFLGAIFVLAYRYTLDDALLDNKIYPFLREIIRFFTAFMEKDASGCYHVPLSDPSEMNCLTRDATWVVGFLKPCLELVVETARRFNRDADERPLWEEVLAGYPPFAVHDGEFLHGTDFGIDFRPEHRGTSLFPFMFYRPKEWESHFRKTAEKIMVPPEEQYHSCSLFFDAFLQIQLGKKRAVLPSIHRQLQALKPSGGLPHISQHPHPDLDPRYREISVTTPEGNCQVTMTITKMLMDSRDGAITLFPGVHGRVDTSFGNLRAEGAFLVSAERVRGRITFVSIEAEAGGTARVQNPWKKKPVVVKGADGKPEIVHGDIIEIAMAKGEIVTLFPKGAKPTIKRIVTDGKPSVKTITFKDGTVVTLGKKAV